MRVAKASKLNQDQKAKPQNQVLKLPIKKKDVKVAQVLNRESNS